MLKTMLGLAIGLAMGTACSSTYAQTSPSIEAVGQACGYSAINGVEFEFVPGHEGSLEYSYLIWTQQPGSLSGTRLPYTQYLGKRGKFLNTITTALGSSFHDAITSDCERLYLYAGENNLLTTKRAEAGNVKIVSGRFPTPWFHTAKTDEMTDEKTCSVQVAAPGRHPAFLLNKHGWALATRGDEYPGKPLTARVDSKKAISQTTMISGASFKALMAQINAGGKSLLIESYEWPSPVPVTGQYNLDGLQEELKACEAATK